MRHSRDSHFDADDEDTSGLSRLVGFWDDAFVRKPSHWRVLARGLIHRSRPQGRQSKSLDSFQRYSYVLIWILNYGVALYEKLWSDYSGPKKTDCSQQRQATDHRFEMLEALEQGKGKFQKVEALFGAGGHMRFVLKLLYYALLHHGSDDNTGHVPNSPILGAVV